MDMDQTVPQSLAYLVHDVDDAAVRRRIDFLVSEGFTVELGGFHRRSPVIDIAGWVRTVDLGRTRDAALGRRILIVLRHLMLPRSIRALCDSASVIVARNLEMLALAWRVRRPGQRLVYECLDIHRLMLGGGGKSRLLRWIERELLKRTDLVIVSSPAFAREYFERRQGRPDRVLLIENKVPRVPGRSASGDRILEKKSSGEYADRPFVIGWFGMLRCRRSLQELLTLADQLGGRIEIVIAGMPSPAEFPDFPAVVTGRANVRYLGAYRPAELAELYAGVDFVWAIDYFEEGLNSAWLLPNRLYEGLAHGAIPIALRAVETGRWLDQRQVGLLVDEASKEIPALVETMTHDQYMMMRVAIAALPEDALYQTEPECRSIIDAIAGYCHA
ncbi:succinoglycan biosynthesis protein ExoL [Novosphingobium gossypii]